MVGKYSNKIDFVHTKGNGLAMDETAFKNTIRHLSIFALKNFKMSSKRSLQLCVTKSLYQVCQCMSSQVAQAAKSMPSQHQFSKILEHLLLTKSQITEKCQLP